MILRQEKPEDYPEVHELITNAFSDMAESDHTEQFLVERLHNSTDFIPELSVVAEIEGKIVGYILLSKIKIENKDFEFPSLALAPVAVLRIFRTKELVRL